MTEMEWLPSLVAEVSAHLGPEKLNLPPVGRVPSGPGTRWAYHWGNHHFAVDQIDPWPSDPGPRWEVLAGGLGRHVKVGFGYEQPTVDDVRRVLEVAGLLPPSEATRLRQVCEQYRLHAVEVGEALAAALDVDPEDDLTDMDMVDRLRVQVAELSQLYDGVLRDLCPRCAVGLCSARQPAAGVRAAIVERDTVRSER